MRYCRRDCRRDCRRVLHVFSICFVFDLPTELVVRTGNAVGEEASAKDANLRFDDFRAIV